MGALGRSLGTDRAGQIHGEKEGSFGTGVGISELWGSGMLEGTSGQSLSWCSCGAPNGRKVADMIWVVDNTAADDVDGRETCF